MGQTIEINRHVRLGDVLVIDTDRSITGQDGHAYTADVEPGHDDYGSMLARRLFDADDAIDHVHVLSNTVTVRRPGGWDDAATDVAIDTVARFFIFYR